MRELTSFTDITEQGLQVLYSDSSHSKRKFDIGQLSGVIYRSTRSAPYQNETADQNDLRSSDANYAQSSEDRNLYSLCNGSEK